MGDITSSLVSTVAFRGTRRVKKKLKESIKKKSNIFEKTKSWLHISMKSMCVYMRVCDLCGCCVAWRSSCVSVTVIQQDSRCCRHLLGSTRQSWSECAVLLSQGLSQQGCLRPSRSGLSFFACRVLERTVFLVPGCSCHWSGEEKRLCVGALKPPGPPGGAEPFCLLCFECLSSFTLVYDAVLCYYSEPASQSDGSATLGYRAFQVSCCCDGAAVNGCVVCLCSWCRWCHVTQ